MPAARPRLSIVSLGFAVIGLAASLASLIDWMGGAPTFCAETGCATVRESAWAHPLGIPMPVLGVAFYAAALGLAFVDAPRLRKALAIAGGAWAVLLIVLQGFVIHAWCKLCMVADPAAIGYAVVVLAGASTLRLTGGRVAAMAPALLGAVGALALWARSPAPAAPTLAPTPTMPAFVADAQKPGVATVVEFVDFECPFCRRMQTELTAAIAKAKGPVQVVRKMFPLSMHEHAMPAALAYCCADLQGKGAEMAEALFAADPDSLTDEGCEKLAVGVGCDLERYREDMPRAKERVAAETAEARKADIRSLPTLFIGSERVVGARAGSDELAAMLDRAVAQN